MELTMEFEKYIDEKFTMVLDKIEGLSGFVKDNIARADKQREDLYVLDREHKTLCSTKHQEIDKRINTIEQRVIIEEGDSKRRQRLIALIASPIISFIFAAVVFYLMNGGGK